MSSISLPSNQYQLSSGRVRVLSGFLTVQWGAEGVSTPNPAMVKGQLYINRKQMVC